MSWVFYVPQSQIFDDFQFQKNERRPDLSSEMTFTVTFTGRGAMWKSSAEAQFLAFL